MLIMMIFNISNFIFLQIFISLFWGLFNDETDFRVKVFGTAYERIGICHTGRGATYAFLLCLKFVATISLPPSGPANGILTCLQTVFHVPAAELSWH